jgi:cation transporter-like permease
VNGGDVQSPESPSPMQQLIKLSGNVHAKFQLLESKIKLSDTDFTKMRQRLIELDLALEQALAGGINVKEGKAGKYNQLEEETEEGSINSVTSQGQLVVTRDEHGNEVHTYDLATYFNLPYWKILRNRLPWLVGLLFLQSFSAAIMGGFEKLLEEHIIVTLFVPMLVGSGGNAGNQPGVMVTRALSTGELRGKVKPLLRKEAVLALITATTIGVLGFCRVLMDPHPDVISALAIGLSLWFVVFVAIFLGILFSLMMDRCGIDPAAGSAPLLTTIADLIGITLLCLVSTIVFGEKVGK